LQFSKFDIFFKQILADEDGEPHPTALGGLVSMGFILGSLFLVGGMALTFFFDNLQETSALIPQLVGKAMLNEHSFGDHRFDILTTLQFEG
jgi:hypothetical protein